jgi:hypothetical protein
MYLYSERRRQEKLYVGRECHEESLKYGGGGFVGCQPNAGGGVCNGGNPPATILNAYARHFAAIQP